MADPIREYWIERDHEEALTIAHQLSAAPAGVTAQNIIDLNRFCDCCDDDEGYDVPADRMRALRSVGLVEGGRFGRYSTTQQGQGLRAQYFIENRTPPPSASEKGAGHG